MEFGEGIFGVTEMRRGGGGDRVGEEAGIKGLLESCRTRMTATLSGKSLPYPSPLPTCPPTVPVSFSHLLKSFRGGSDCQSLLYMSPG